MIRRPPRSTQSRSSAASDVYKRQVLEGGANMSFMRVPFKLEQKFQYDQVNGGDKLPPIVVDSSSRPRRGGSVGVMIGGPSRADSIREASRTARRKAQCDSTGMHSST